MSFLLKLFFLALLWKNGSLESPEIVKLFDDTNIICTAEEITNSAIFIHPPLSEKSDYINLLEYDWWKNDNWTKKSSEDSYHEAILDKRWEDFTLEYKDVMVFEPNKSATFSVYGSNKIHFVTGDEDYAYNLPVTIDVDDQWTAFTFVIKNQNIYYFQNNKLIHSFEQVGNIEGLKIWTPKKIYVKVHKYSFIESTIPSTKTTSLTIPKIQEAYLIVYISLCPWCMLTISSANKTDTIVSSIKDNDLLQKWQSYKLDIDLTKDVTLLFNRTVVGNQTDGYWSLDVAMYKNKYHKVTYVYNTSESVLPFAKYKCDFLRNNLKNTLKHSHTIHLKTCKPGEFGNRCSIHCEDIFGKSSSTCIDYIDQILVIETQKYIKLSYVNIAADLIILLLFVILVMSIIIYLININKKNVSLQRERLILPKSKGLHADDDADEGWIRKSGK